MFHTWGSGTVNILQYSDNFIASIKEKSGVDNAIILYKILDSLLDIANRYGLDD